MCAIPVTDPRHTDSLLFHAFNKLVWREVLQPIDRPITVIKRPKKHGDAKNIKENLSWLTLSHASLKYRAASSIAPPKRGPIVNNPVIIKLRFNVSAVNIGNLCKG
jgi:hypothetical protein